jgi:hypothetical protein
MFYAFVFKSTSCIVVHIYDRFKILQMLLDYHKTNLFTRIHLKYLTFLWKKIFGPTHDARWAIRPESLAKMGWFLASEFGLEAMEPGQGQHL